MVVKMAFVDFRWQKMLPVSQYLGLVDESLAIVICQSKWALALALKKQ